MNLLNQAMSIIPNQIVEYHKFAGMAANANGFEVATYEAPETLRGIVQPVKRSMYERLGLLLQKKYVTLWIRQNTIDLNRDTSGDKFIFAGATFKLESKTNWHPVDGWDEVLAVKID